MSYTVLEQYSREGILLFSCMISALWYQECVLLHSMQKVIKSQHHSSAGPCTVYLLLYCTTCTTYLSVGCIVICSNVSRLLQLVVSFCSSEDVDDKALVKFWLHSHTPSTEPSPSFESWISDYFYPTLEWVLSAGNQVVMPL